MFLVPSESQVSLRLLKCLRVLASVALACATIVISIIFSQRAWEVVLILGLFGTGGASLLFICWRRPAALLLPSSLLICLVAFAAIGQNLLLIEPVIGIRISNRLDLSPRLMSLALARTENTRAEWEQFGDDPLFYRFSPGSTYRERYDYRMTGEEYKAVVDDLGFLNTERDYYSQHETIDFVIAGDSVMQGIGMPGVIDEIKARVPFSVYSLSTSSYSPRQKTKALLMFALPKRPKWLVIEFYGGNDASESIEDNICEKLRRDYRCRFDLTALARGLSDDPVYGSMADFGDFSSLMEALRRLRSDSLSLALGTGIAQKLRRFWIDSAPQWVRYLDGEAITLPGFTHYANYPERRLDWIREGLDLTFSTYDVLLDKAGRGGARVLIIYNPTSYEIYRDVLTKGLTDHSSDETSRMQMDALRTYAHKKGAEFCDLTSAFRRDIRDGARGLFGRYDGIHWSRQGTILAGKIIVDCLTEVVQREKP